MIKFFATGEDFLQKPQLKLRVPRLASPVRKSLQISIKFNFSRVKEPKFMKETI